MVDRQVGSVIRVGPREHAPAPVALLMLGRAVAGLAGLCSSVVARTGSLDGKSLGVGRSAVRMRMVEAAPAQHVYGHSQHDSKVDSAVHDCSRSKKYLQNAS